MTDTTAAIHPAATDPLPIFITAPGSTDALFVGTAVFVVIFIIGIGLLYWRLHTLPERLAHRTQKVQFQIVAVLGLVALFTHNHAFWIAGLLLSFVHLPDFMTPLKTMAGALSKMAGLHESGEPQNPPSGMEGHATAAAPKPEPPDPHGPRQVQGG